MRAEADVQSSYSEATEIHLLEGFLGNGVTWSLGSKCCGLVRDRTVERVLFQSFSSPVLPPGKQGNKPKRRVCQD